MAETSSKGSTSTSTSADAGKATTPTPSTGPVSAPSPTQPSAPSTGSTAGTPATSTSTTTSTPQKAAESDTSDAEDSDGKEPSPLAPHNRALTPEQRKHYEQAFPPITPVRPAETFIAPIGPSNAPQPEGAFVDGVVNPDALPEHDYKDSMGQVHPDQKEAYQAQQAQKREAKAKSG